MRDQVKRSIDLYDTEGKKQKPDMLTQCFPGQIIPPVDAPNEKEPVEKSTESTSPWLNRDSSGNGRDAEACRRYLDSLSDDEIIELYNAMRDQRIVWDGSYYYPNIKELFLTPLEREKDRREIAVFEQKYGESEVAHWYREAKAKSCVWWLENHLVAKHSFNSCMNCGLCTAACPAAEFYDYDPREIMEIVQRKDEEEIIGLLKSGTLWFCGQCGSCKTRCPRSNSPFGLISSLRQLSQLKGFHTGTVKGRQQYGGRHLWGGNFWNRGWSLYFRNLQIESHLDFGPRFARNFLNIEESYRRVGAAPDMNGSSPGRKVPPETLQQIRRCFQVGGTLFLWDNIEHYAQEQAHDWGLDIDDYFYKVMHEG